MSVEAFDHVRAAAAALPAVTFDADQAPAPHAVGHLWLALVLPGLALTASGQVAADAPPRAVSVFLGRRPCLLCVDGKARGAGVHEDMSVTAATALCPALHVTPHDPQAEAMALDGLAAWALRYTSRVSLEPPRGLMLEIGASLRLFGGLEPLLTQLRADLKALGHEVLEGIAPTPMAAWLLARAGVREPVTLAARLAGVLAAVPVQCLHAPARMMGDLQDLGVRTLGDCMRLPRDGLSRRFGPDLVALLDRALGRSPDPRICWSPPARFQRRVDLAFESADRGVLVAAARHLVHELAGFLTARACGACALELQLAHRGMPATRLVLEMISPCRDPEHLLAMLAERLERVSIEHEVLYLGLRVQRLQMLAPRTGDLYARRGSLQEPSDAREARRQAELLVERLGARLGHDAVRTPVRVTDHRPERSSTDTPWHQDAGKSPQDSYEAMTGQGMPLWLLPRPRPLDGGLINGAAGALLDGCLSVEHGPQRIESGWWDGADVARDYYVARSTRGTRYWISRECRAPRRWFVHGIFA